MAHMTRALRTIGLVLFLIVFAVFVADTVRAWLASD